MKYKETRSLFLGTYQYKVVLICPGATLFRGGDFDNALKELDKLDHFPKHHSHWANRIKTAEDLEYSKALCTDLKKLQNFDLRIENPAVNIYTNNLKDVNLLTKKYGDNIKYISKPADGNVLTRDTVVMTKMDYEFRVTMGATKQEYSTFIDWAETNAKIKLTKSCKRDLARSRSWGGTHFYVTGENNLLMVKMHLGSTLSKVERIIKQLKD
jgi:hypothetical protein